MWIIFDAIIGIIQNNHVRNKVVTADTFNPNTKHYYEKEVVQNSNKNIIHDNISVTKNKKTNSDLLKQFIDLNLIELKANLAVLKPKNKINI